MGRLLEMLAADHPAMQDEWATAGSVVLVKRPCYVEKHNRAFFCAGDAGGAVVTNYCSHSDELQLGVCYR